MPTRPRTTIAFGMLPRVDLHLNGVALDGLRNSLSLFHRPCPNVQNELPALLRAAEPSSSSSAAFNLSSLLGLP